MCRSAANHRSFSMDEGLLLTRVCETGLLEMPAVARLCQSGSCCGRATVACPLTAPSFSAPSEARLGHCPATTHCPDTLQIYNTLSLARLLLQGRHTSAAGCLFLVLLDGERAS